MKFSYLMLLLFALAFKEGDKENGSKKENGKA